jgi:hypothetical protein
VRLRPPPIFGIVLFSKTYSNHDTRLSVDWACCWIRSGRIRDIATFAEFPQIYPQPDGRSAIWSHNLASLNPSSPASSSSSLGGSFSHRRRRSSFANPLQTLNIEGVTSAHSDISPSRGGPQILPPIPGTPNFPMSLSRSPSPRPGGGWASPGLNSPAFANVSGRSSPHRSYGGSNGNGNSVTWESVKAKTEGVNGYPSFSTQNTGFFNRHYRKLSSSLPRFSIGSEKSYAEKEKLGRWRWMPNDGSRLGRLRAAAGKVSRKMRLRLLVGLAFIMMFILFYTTRKLCQPEPLKALLTRPALHYWWRRTKFLGGGKKFVIILAANQGGGVMEWKGPREWAIERDSVRNKRKYANKWGYDLEIVDMSTKKRYAHEWRESWEKVDTVRNCLRKYPDAEW